MARLNNRASIAKLFEKPGDILAATDMG